MADQEPSDFHPIKAPEGSRQAVVVIHGIGEQRPMETLRSIVKNLWQTDTESDLEEGDKESPENEGVEKIRIKRSRQYGTGTWVAPARFMAENGNNHELMRIVTGSHDRYSRDENGNSHKDTSRTDFYEFYWADILAETRFITIWPWLKELLFRSYRHVPDNAFTIWIVLWFFASVFLVTIGGLFISLYSLAIYGREAWVSLLQPLVKAPAFEAVIPIFTALLLGFFVSWFLAAIVHVVLEPDPDEDIEESHSSRVIQGIMIGIVVLLVALAVAFAVEGFYESAAFKNPVAKIALLHLLAILLIIGIFQIRSSFFVPYFGDVALYLHRSPNTLEKRNRIHERGLQLLRQLHDDPTYDRVILVTHSLGAVVGYNLVRLLWPEYGPTGPNTDIDLPLRKAFNEVGDFVREQEKNYPGEQHWPRADLLEYREKQKRLFWALQHHNGRTDDEGKPRKWKISDLITLGSPLSHAEFLLETTEDRLRALMKDRTLITCPPVLNETDAADPTNSVRLGGFLYDTTRFDPRLQANRTVSVAHHAAAFAAVRWTNIYDFRSLVVLGDFISGPANAHFGKGIYEIHLRMEHDTRFMFLNRFVTHNYYWKWKTADNRQIVHSAARGDTVSYRRDETPFHIQALRAATDLTFSEREPLSEIKQGQQHPASEDQKMKYVVVAITLIVVAAIAIPLVSTII